MKGSKYFVCIIIGGCLVSCTEKKDSLKSGEDVFTSDERLLGWTSKLITEDFMDEKFRGYCNDHENFIKPYFSSTQSGDTLILSTIMEVNTCGKAVGDIHFSGDTLFLKTKETAGELCTSLKYCTYTYKVYNPDKKEYIVISEQ